MRILLTGGSGQVGTELRRIAPESWSVDAPPRSDFDLANRDGISAVVANGNWDLIVNAGAYTAVDKAESELADAWKANAVGVAVLADQAARKGVPLIHISTDYVFDGEKADPYREDDPVCPLGVYGASKAAGELAVIAARGRSIVLRTAWVFSNHGNNFVKTMLRVGAERALLRVVDDQRGCPTSATEIASTLVKIAPGLAAGDAAGGIYHIVGGGEGTWYDLAQHVFARAARNGAKKPEVEPIPTSQYPTPAKRPANSRLSTTKLERDFGIIPRPWRDAVDDVVDKLLNPGGAHRG